MSNIEHESGSDRIAEAAHAIECDIIINVQGDEPFTESESLRRLIEVLVLIKKRIDLASLMVKIDDVKEINNSSVLELTDKDNFTLFF